jgi:hypothetical protein
MNKLLDTQQDYEKRLSKLCTDITKGANTDDEQENMVKIYAENLIIESLLKPIGNPETPLN